MSAKARILIIDDEPSHLKLYSWILEREGFHTTTAQVNHAGLDLPREQQFDLILLDYRFSSSITAVDVAHKIKEYWPGMRIVILSDMMWMPDDIAHLVDDFVHKGEPQQLVDKVGEILNR
ncbi:MAG TPA: response regulator [Candidatus Angelobacter sp.]|nr:response regulator [Candidatus Angelobacter sp.]